MLVRLKRFEKVISLLIFQKLKNTVILSCCHVHFSLIKNVFPSPQITPECAQLILLVYLEDILHSIIHYSIGWLF